MSRASKRTTDMTEFEEGEEIRVYYRTSPSAPSSTIEGEVEIRYNEKKIGFKRSENNDLVIADFSTDAGEDNLRVLDSNLRLHESDEVLGWAMFAESASLPEPEDGVR